MGGGTAQGGAAPATSRLLPLKLTQLLRQIGTNPCLQRGQRGQVPRAPAGLHAAPPKGPGPPSSAPTLSLGRPPPVRDTRCVPRPLTHQ